MAHRLIYTTNLLLATALANTVNPETVEMQDLVQLVLETDVGASEHDNDVHFSGADIAFNETSHVITSGQPYSGVTTAGDDMDVHAGRKGSEEPASAFTMGLGITNVIGLNALDQMPKDLNFVVIGDMTFNFSSGNSFTCPEFRVGQGHSGFSNNWWVGSSDCYSVPTTHQLTCCCGNSRCNASVAPGGSNYAVEIRQGDDDSDFKVYEWTN